VDTNLRFPRQHLLFGLENRTGLSNLLAGRGDVREAIQTTNELANLHVLTAGSIPPNPQELFARSSLTNLFEEFAASFTYVILDTAPSFANADSVAVVSQAGGALMVVRKDHTTLSEVQAVQAQVANAGATIIGSVLWAS
jgi:protein-tyrosine kinase